MQTVGPLPGAGRTHAIDIPVQQLSYQHPLGQPCDIWQRHASSSKQPRLPGQMPAQTPAHHEHWTTKQPSKCARNMHRILQCQVFLNLLQVRCVGTAMQGPSLTPKCRLSQARAQLSAHAAGPAFPACFVSHIANGMSCQMTRACMDGLQSQEGKQKR